MSILSDIGWWFDHLPSAIDDVSTAVTRSTRDALKGAARNVWCTHGTAGVQQASEVCDVLDKELESGVLTESASDPDLLNLARRAVGESLFDAHCVSVVRSLLKGLKKWRYSDGRSEQIPDDRANCAETGFVDRQTTAGLNSSAGLAKLNNTVASYAIDILEDVLPASRWSEALETTSGRTGPGAVLSGFSATERWSEIYKSHNNWGLTNGLGHSNRGICPPSLTTNLWGSSFQLEDVNLLSAYTCRLAAVPKDMWKHRLVTVPDASAAYKQHWCRNALLWCMSRCKSTQHLLSGNSGVFEPDGVWETLVRRFDDAQEVQQALARMGSASCECEPYETATKRIVTVDMKDASDWITWSQVSRLFPIHVAEALQSCRASTYITKDKVSHPMFSYDGMGNATTFVVETLVFWAVTEACRRLNGIPGKIWVYGDDVIMSNQLWNTVGEKSPMVAYEALDWQLNAKKSFTKLRGHFRESCGVQAFAGKDVTYTAFHGYDLAKVEDAVGCKAKIQQIADQMPSLAQEMLTEATFRNYAGAPIGGISCVDIPWLKQTPRPKSVSSRARRCKPVLGSARINTDTQRIEYFESYPVCVRQKPTRSLGDGGMGLLLAWWSNSRVRSISGHKADGTASMPVSYAAACEAFARDSGNSYTVWKRVSAVSQDLFKYRRELGLDAPDLTGTSIPKVAVTMDPLPRRTALCRGWLPTSAWGV